jgi:cytosine/adenosine deaminase-related metal-dependent hydrolase
MLVEAAQPSNVDTVVVDGRVLKRGGELVGVDVAEIVAAARTAVASVRRRANW